MSSVPNSKTVRYLSQGIERALYSVDHQREFARVGRLLDAAGSEEEARRHWQQLQQYVLERYKSYDPLPPMSEVIEYMFEDELRTGKIPPSLRRWVDPIRDHSAERTKEFTAIITQAYLPEPLRRLDDYIQSADQLAQKVLGVSKELEPGRYPVFADRYKKVFARQGAVSAAKSTFEDVLQGMNLHEASVDWVNRTSRAGNQIDQPLYTLAQKAFPVLQTLHTYLENAGNQHLGKHHQLKLDIGGLKTQLMEDMKHIDTMLTDSLPLTQSLFAHLHSEVSSLRRNLSHARAQMGDSQTSPEWETHTESHHIARLQDTATGIQSKIEQDEANIMMALKMDELKDVSIMQYVSFEIIKRELAELSERIESRPGLARKQDIVDNLTNIDGVISDIAASRSGRERSPTGTQRVR